MNFSSSCFFNAATAFGILLLFEAAPVWGAETTSFADPCVSHGACTELQLNTDEVLGAQGRTLMRPRFGLLLAGVSEESGNQSLTNSLGVLGVELAENYELTGNNRPGFKFYEGPGALASRYKAFPSTSGTVFVGRQLLRAELAASTGGAAIAGVVAHEFAHIYQYVTGYYSQLRTFGERALREPTDRFVELHADFLAGWFLGSREYAKGLNEQKAFFYSFFEKGDYLLNEVNPKVREKHHGNPSERVAALVVGYLASAVDNVDIQTAASIGEQFVTKCLNQSNCSRFDFE